MYIIIDELLKRGGGDESQYLCYSQIDARKRLDGEGWGRGGEMW